MSDAPDLLAALAQSLDKAREKRHVRDNHIDRAAQIIAAHIGSPARGGTAAGAWVDCRCGTTVDGVSRDHATNLHHKHVAQALDAAGLLAKYPHLEVEGDWLIEVVNYHTCGAGPGSGAGHEPGCGTVPVMPLASPAHDAAVAAKALREAAAFVDEYAYEPSDVEKPPSGQERGFYLGATEAHRVVYRLLNERADRIEREGGDDADA